MFRACILAIVRLSCKLNKQLYNMCVGYCGGNEISSYISGLHVCNNILIHCYIILTLVQLLTYSMEQSPS